jgi:hypothetical protein
MGVWVLLKIESDILGVEGIEGVADEARSKLAGVAGEMGDKALSACFGDMTGEGEEGVWTTGVTATVAGFKGNCKAMGMEANNDWAKTAVSKDLLQGMFKAAAAC